MARFCVITVCFVAISLGVALVASRFTITITIKPAAAGKT